MPRERFTAVTFRDTYPQESVADHEVLMAFNGDPDAAAFREWWDEQGNEMFALWLKKQKTRAADDF